MMKRSELRNIIKEELRALREGYGPYPKPDIDLEEMASAIGYGSFDDFIDDNPGAKKAIIDWTLTVSDFAGSLKRKGLSEDLQEADKNINTKHIAQIKDMLNTLSIMKTELDSDVYTGFGAVDGDLTRLAVSATDNLFKLARLIKKNAK